MKLLHLTPMATARVWRCAATPGFVVKGSVSKDVGADAATEISAQYAVLEAFLPRGARSEYGLLGIRFEPRTDQRLRVDVHCSDEDGVRWPDAMGNQVDDVRLGLPGEYAEPILEALIGFAASRFPPGRISVHEAAYGVVGSSRDVFRRIAVGALSLMLDEHECSDDEMTVLLKRVLLG